MTLYSCNVANADQQFTFTSTPGIIANAFEVKSVSDTGLCIDKFPTGAGNGGEEILKDCTDATTAYSLLIQTIDEDGNAVDLND